MVSPSPIETLTVSTSSTKMPTSCSTALVAPSPTMQASINKATAQAKHPYSAAFPPRMKRTTSFINMQTDDPQPYFWSLNDENLPSAPHPGLDSAASPSADLFLADMPPMQYAFGEELSQYNFSKPLPFIESDCERCWETNAKCDECRLAKRNQFTSDGWPVEQPQLFDQFSYIKQEPYDTPMTDTDHSNWIKQELVQPPTATQEDHPMEPTEEKSDSGLPPLSAPLNVGADSLARVQGKLTKFLPDGQMMQVDYVDPNYTTAFEYQVAHAPTMSEGRSMRQRKAVQRSRSPSPDLSDRSTTPDSLASDSAYDTDQYDPQEDEPMPHQPKHHFDQHVMDDTMSPPVVRYDDSASSGQSSSEPPVPNRLLPVSAKDLLPSRPSTAAIPPAHIKDRLVKSAKKLLTAADGVNDSVQVQVIPIWYPAKGASGAHKIRLIRVENTSDRSVSVYAHAADVGGVVERKSNISRLFGKFESPSEKLLMNVVGAHNHTVGQESNILTSKGVRKFLALNKMKDENAYRAWINSILLPKLLHDPLEIGEELLEIEASTDPHMPHQIKPKKMKRMEKKQQRREQEKKEEEMKEKRNMAQQGQGNLTGASSPPAKRQKSFHSPIPSSTALFLSPNMAPFNPFLMQQHASAFTLGANTSA